MAVAATRADANQATWGGRGRLVRRPPDAEGHRAALDTARQLRVPLPTAAAAAELLTPSRALGYERRDLAVLYEVLAQQAGGAVRSLA